MFLFMLILLGNLSPCLVFQVFVNEVNTHREQVLALEKAGSQLRFASLKQDVVLIKNLLLSVQARWDKLVQRSLDRGRHLDEARKRAKQVLFVCFTLSVALFIPLSISDVGNLLLSSFMRPGGS